MAWEPRGNGTYYYRKRRIGDSIASEYVGTGPVAELLALEDEKQREEAARQARQWRTIRAADKALEREVNGIIVQARAITKCTLLLSGFRTCKGTWRMTKEASQHIAKEDRQELSNRKFWEVMARVDSENPTRADLDELEGIYRDVPALYREVLGLVARTREKMLVSFIPQASGRAAIRHEIEDMRSGMNFDDANGLERLIIDTVILSWLRMQQAEYSLSSVDTADAMSYWDARVSAAQRRFLRASETLARVRKLTTAAKGKGAMNAVALLNALT